MRAIFLATFIAGLLLGVASMLAGIDRDQRRGRWVRWINLPTIATAAVLFGVVGYPLAKYTALGVGALLATAGGAALLGAGGMVLLIAGWAVPSAEREVEDERYRLQGHLARVTRDIGPIEPGEIAFEHEGRQHAVRARAVGTAPVPRGTEVVIERIEDDVAYVELWSHIERELRLTS